MKRAGVLATAVFWWFASAAHADGRIEINQAVVDAAGGAYTLNKSGSYVLTGNVVVTTGGINITVDDVDIDLKGFSLFGGGIADSGIDLNGRSNVTVRNGTVRGFGHSGIADPSGGGTGNRVLSIRALDNGTPGSGDAYSGIHLLSTLNTIEGCTARGNRGNGILSNSRSRLLDNTAYGNSGTYAIVGTGSSIISGNIVENNSGMYGIAGGQSATITNNTVTNHSEGEYAIHGAQGAVIRENAVRDNDTQYGIYAAGNASVIGNTVSGSRAGIDANTSSVVVDNTVTGSTGTGIRATVGSSISGNVVTLSLTGIDASDSTVIGNTVRENRSWGINLFSGSLARENLVDGNNTIGSSSAGGINAEGSNQIIGNHLTGNRSHNLYVNGSANVIERNVLLLSTGNGIYFNATGNYYADNRARGNVPNYGNVGTNTNGGGNVSF